MRKIISIAFFAIFFCLVSQNVAPNHAAAADEWVYTAPDGTCLYIVYNSVVYGRRTSFYARARIKALASSGELIKEETWEYGKDEGIWWVGIYGQKGSGRKAYDYPDTTAVLEWLKDHRDEAHTTADITILVLAE